MMNKHNKWILEWFKQADYDLRTAEAMFKNRRYIYTVFMCHLSIEKALKGLYLMVIRDNPPKIHDLIYFLGKIKLEPPEGLNKFIGYISQVSIMTRYPGSLAEMQKVFPRGITSKILRQTERVLKWAKKELDK